MLFCYFVSFLSWRWIKVFSLIYTNKYYHQEKNGVDLGGSCGNVLGEIYSVLCKKYRSNKHNILDRNQLQLLDRKMKNLSNNFWTSFGQTFGQTFKQIFEQTFEVVFENIFEH